MLNYYELIIICIKKLMALWSSINKNIKLMLLIHNKMIMGWLMSVYVGHILIRRTKDFIFVSY